MMLPSEVLQLSTFAAQAGTQDPVPVLQAISMIDTDTIRAIGREVWTESHASFGPTTSYRARFVLETEADQLLIMLNPSGWDDLRYEAFERRITGLVERMRELADQCAVVGDTLVMIADEFELQWIELIGLVISAVGYIVAVVGAAIAVAAWWTGVGLVSGLIVAIIGLIIAFAGYIVSLWTTVKPRLDALAEAQDRIEPRVRWVEPGEE